MRKLLFLVLLFFISTIAQAEVTVEAIVDPKSGTAEDSFVLQVVVSGDFLKVGRTEFNHSEEFEITYSGSSNRTEIINSKRSHQVTFSYMISPSGEIKIGKYLLPSGALEIDGEKKEFSGPEINILGASANQEKQGKASNNTKQGVEFTQVVDNYEPYVGEQVLYRAEIASSKSIANGSLEDLSFNGFWRESFGKNAEQKRNVGGLLVFSLLEGIFPNKEGELEIPMRKFSAKVEVVEQRDPRRPWDLFDRFFDDADVFASRRLVPISILAPGVKIRAKPLPPPPRSNLSYIPVGNVRVSSAVKQPDAVGQPQAVGPQTVKQGESITLTIEINADANLRPYELSQVQGKDLNSFKIYTDQPTIETGVKGNKIYFKKVWKIALVCQKPGKFQVPQYEIVSFDPQLKQYKTETTLTKEIEVLADITGNHLQVYGEQKEEKEKIQEKEDTRKDIQLLSEDLRPQRLSPALYQPAYKFNNNFLILLCALPLATFLFCYFNYLRTLNSGTSEISLSKKAFSKAQVALSEKDIDLDSLASIFRKYFGEKFIVQAESLTASDIKALILQKSKNLEFATKAESLFGDIQKYLYAGLQVQESELLALVVRTKNLIEEIDKNV